MYDDAVKQTNLQTKQGGIELVTKYHMCRQVLQGEFNIIVIKMEFILILGQGPSQSYLISNKKVLSLVLRMN